MAGSVALSRRTWTVLLVALSGACAFMLRLVIPYRTVFGGDVVSFGEPDASYHMRLVDALIRDFPNRIWFDPYLRHPGGDSVHVGPFFDWVVAAAALVLGGGSPGERLVDQVGALVPAIFGALTVVPVYVLGRELFSRWAGLWAAAIVGVLPGQFLLRSLVGFTDHHSAEVFLSTLTLMLLVLALRCGSTPRGLIYAVSSGFSLGCYLLTWSGGALLVAILAAWGTLQMLVERNRGRSGSGVVQALVPGLVVGGLMILPWVRTTSQHGLQIVALVAGVAVVLFLYGLARATLGLARGRTIYVSGMLTGGVAAGALVNWLAGDLVTSALGALSRLSPTRTLAIAAEAEPLITSNSWGPVPLWDQFTISLFLAVFALGYVVSDLRGAPQPRRVLFLVWTGGMLLATIGQVRFSYYLAVNVALCAGYACDVLLGWRRRPGQEPEVQPVHLPSAAAGAPRRVGAATVLAGAGLAALLVLPNVSTYRTLANMPANPTPAWIDALNWLRYQTPDPFGDPGVYYASFGSGARDQVAPPRAAYGVLSWWDYGYWILRMGRRVPIANPKQTGVGDAARFLLAEDESEAAVLADDLGVRYVIVNWELQAQLGPNEEIRIGFLQNMAGALGAEPTRYVRVAYRTTAGEQQPVVLYEPAYYRTMMSRLYRADLDSSGFRSGGWAVTLEERTRNGSPYLELVAESYFPDCGEARAFVEAAGSRNVRLVGRNPFVTCESLPPLREFTRAYRSLDVIEYGGEVGPPMIQIFERAFR